MGNKPEKNYCKWEEWQPRTRTRSRWYKLWMDICKRTKLQIHQKTKHAKHLASKNCGSWPSSISPSRGNIFPLNSFGTPNPIWNWWIQYIPPSPVVRMIVLLGRHSTSLLLKVLWEHLQGCGLQFSLYDLLRHSWEKKSNSILQTFCTVEYNG